ncbi:MAG: DoxX family membrane protein [Saprospiraceae bacterium]|jgi:uncharacterized membrane protein YphA (DoxX/SURF4 family)|nr:DoxX family membrane protein [Saprospiraceae bacterium]
MRAKRFIYDSFRIILGIVFLSSGIGKFYGTSGLIGPGWLFEELAKYDLLFFAIFIALAELVIGYLLLIRKYSTIGAIMLFPMITNILVVVISLNWRGTPLIDGVFLMMNAYLLYFDRSKLYPILGIDNAKQLGLLLKKTAIYNLGLLFIILGVLLAYYSANHAFKYITRLGFLIILGKAGYQYYFKRKQND